MDKKIKKQNIILFLLVIVIVIAPLIFIKDSEFGGADDSAGEVIEEMIADFEPWAEPIMEPPGGETESLLFALQAAIGAGVIFYFIGYLKGKSEVENIVKA